MSNGGAYCELTALALFGSCNESSPQVGKLKTGKPGCAPASYVMFAPESGRLSRQIASRISGTRQAVCHETWSGVRSESDPSGQERMKLLRYGRFIAPLATLALVIGASWIVLEYIVHLDRTRSRLLEASRDIAVTQANETKGPINLKVLSRRNG
jgi:hypothetical protein